MKRNLILLAESLGKKLKSNHQKLVTAESCTGGGLGYYITSISGSSDWYERGFITYSNESKIEMLGVDQTSIHQFGAVSQPVAEKMALNALDRSNAQVSIAITGIAGPTGESEDKPVGLVWIACAGKNFRLQTEKFLFSGDRQAVRESAMAAAFNQLIKIL